MCLNLKDLAEYFESADGSKIEASYLVALEGDKIRKAHVGDKILGVVSKNSRRCARWSIVLLE
ncbi:peptidase G2 autoproteolytic cleavage domain-containing protein [Bacillus velezensis]